MLGDPILDVAGLDRLPIPEDLKDGKQKAIPGRHLAHCLRAITHARQVIRATENQLISVCSPFTGGSSPCSRPPPRDIREPHRRDRRRRHALHRKVGHGRRRLPRQAGSTLPRTNVLPSRSPTPHRGEPGKLAPPRQPMRPPWAGSHRPQQRSPVRRRHRRSEQVRVMTRAHR